MDSLITNCMFLMRRKHLMVFSKIYPSELWLKLLVLA
jgi:hypothetical protein